jgi:hypothetical protein
MVISVDQLISFLLGPFGTLVLVLLIIYTGYKKMWVFGWYATELSKRNERLENRIDDISGTSKSIVSVTDKILEGKTEANSDL